MNKSIKTRVASICMAFVLCFAMLQGTGATVVKAGTSPYVKLVSISKSGSTVTLKYKVTQAVPNGATVVVGMEYPATYRQSAKTYPVGKKGTYTKTFTIAGGYARIYTELSARNYKDKQVFGTYSNVPTGTSYHTITKGEANLNTAISIAIGVGLTLYSPATAVGSRVLKVVGVGFTLGSAFSYAPRVGDYLVTKTTFNSSTGKYVANVKVYGSKASYQKGDKPVSTYSNSYTIPKF